MDVREKAKNENRLIDAAKLLEIYKKWIPQLSSKEDEGDRRGVETCIAVLEDMQTVDAVTVVRCWKCKNWHEETGFCEKHSYFVDDNGVCCSPADSQNWTMFEPDDFCSRGERKEGAD